MKLFICYSFTWGFYNSAITPINTLVKRFLGSVKKNEFLIIGGGVWSRSIIYDFSA